MNLTRHLTYLFLIISFLIGCAGLFGGGDDEGILTWAKSYGGTGSEHAYAVQQTDDDGDGEKDDGFIFVGTTGSSSEDNNDILVQKLDSFGDVEWAKTYGESNLPLTVASAIKKTTDGGFIVAGWIDTDDGDADIGVVRLDNNGGILWQRNFGGSDDDKAYAVQQTFDGGYIVAGILDNPLDPFRLRFEGRIWVNKLDANGNTEAGWPTTYVFPEDIPSSGAAYHIQQMGNGNYIVAGTVAITIKTEPATILYQPLVFELNATGERIKAFVYKQDLTSDQALAAPHSTIFDLQAVGDSYYFTWGPVDDEGNKIGVYTPFELDAGLNLKRVEALGVGTAIDLGIGLNIHDQQIADNGEIIMLGSYAGGGAGQDIELFKNNIDFFYPGSGGSSSTEGTRFTHIYDETPVAVKDVPDGGYIVLAYADDGLERYVRLLRINAAFEEVWSGDYQIEDNATPHSIEVINNNSFILAGASRKLDSTRRAWIMKVSDSNGPVKGAVEWQKSYRANTDDVAYAIEPIGDDYMVAGFTESSGTGGKDVLLLNLTTNGEINWQKTFGEADSHEVVRSIQQTTDGYLLTGYSQSTSGGAKKAWLLKLNVAGEQEEGWPQTYADSADEEAYSITTTSDGGHIVVGVSRSNSISYDIWVLKLDVNSTVQWKKYYGEALVDELAYAIQTTKDDGYIIAGCSDCVTDTSQASVWVLKLDGNGDVQWSRNYGGAQEDVAYSIAVNPDDAYVVTGHTKSFGGGEANVWVLHLAEDGSLDWQKTYGTAANDRSHNVRLSADGGYVVAGWTDGITGSYDAWLLKLDANGNISSSCPSGMGSDSSATASTSTSTSAVNASVDIFPAVFQAMQAGINAVDFVDSDVTRQCAGFTPPPPPPTHTLSLTIVGEGRASGCRANAHCDWVIEENREIDLGIVANVGWQLESVEGDCSAAGRVVMDSDKACTVTFTRIPNVFVLTVTKEGAGSVSNDGGEISCGRQCRAAFPVNSIVPLTAIPDTGQMVHSLWDDCVGSDTTPEITMDADKKCHVIFVKEVLPKDPIADFEWHVPAASGVDRDVSVVGKTIEFDASYSVVFDPNTVVADNQAILKYEWDFDGDGIYELAGDYDSGRIVRHTYTQAGSFDVTLRVTGNFSAPIEEARDTYSQAIEVKETFLRVFREGDGSGNVSSSPVGIDCGSGGADCFEYYPSGSTVVLTPTADAGSQFIGWGGWDSDYDCTDGSVTLDAISGQAKTCVARFIKVGSNNWDYTLQVQKTGTGSGNVMALTRGVSCGPTCALYVAGSKTTLKAIADVGSIFTGWGGDCSGSDEEHVVTIDRSKTCTANFEDGNANLTITTSGNGKVTAININCGSDCSAGYDKDTLVSLFAVADANAVFAGWSGDDCNGYGFQTQIWIQMSRDKSCHATFSPVEDFSLSVSKDGTGGGTVKTVNRNGATYTVEPGVDCGTDCYETFTPGTVVTLIAIQDSGSVFRQWSGSCSGTDIFAEVTVDGLENCTATFNVPVTLNLSVSVTGQGGITDNFGFINCGTTCSKDYIVGTSVTLTASPTAGWQFGGWSGDCSGAGLTTVVSISISNKSCQATFVNQTPIASFTFSPASPQSGDIVSFDASSSSDDGSIVSYEWDFQYDGSFNLMDSGVNATHVYNPLLTATFTARLRVTDNGGLTHEASQAITVTVPSGCCTLTADASKGSKTGVVYAVDPPGISCGTFDGTDFTDCSETYSVGTAVALRAEPSTGATFSHWVNCAPENNINCSVTMDSNKTVEAHFD